MGKIIITQWDKYLFKLLHLGKEIITIYLLFNY